MIYLLIWWRANFQDWPYWRVTYKDGVRTRLLFWREANGCKETFNGKLWIDYKAAAEIIKRTEGIK